MTLTHYHYADSELSSIAGVEAEALNWLAVSWDLESTDFKETSYAQMVVGPGVFLHRSGPMEDRPFVPGSGVRHVYHHAYPWKDERTMLQLAIEQTEYNKGTGYILKTSPFLVDFTEFAEQYQNDTIRTLGDLIVYSNSRIVASIFDHITTQRNGALI